MKCAYDNLIDSKFVRDNQLRLNKHAHWLLHIQILSKTSLNLYVVRDDYYALKLNVYYLLRTKFAYVQMRAQLEVPSNKMTLNG